MKIQNRSMISGKVNTIEIHLSHEEFETAYENWQNGTLLQDAFPTLDASEREFIKTGITSEEWDAMCNGADEEDEEDEDNGDDLGLLLDPARC